MAFFHSCLLCLTQLPALAGANPVPVAADFAMPVAQADKVLLVADSSNQSLARLALAAVLAGEAATESSSDSDDESDGQNAPDFNLDDSKGDGATIPGAFVAVIFGVFGLLVIARRSQR